MRMFQYIGAVAIGIITGVFLPVYNNFKNAIILIMILILWCCICELIIRSKKG